MTMIYVGLGIALVVILLHMYVSIRYQYDWIGQTTKKFFRRTHPEGPSVTDLYAIPATPYMDRFSEFTKVPRMKHNAF